MWLLATAVTTPLALRRPLSGLTTLSASRSGLLRAALWSLSTCLWRLSACLWRLLSASLLARTTLLSRLAAAGWLCPPAGSRLALLALGGAVPAPGTLLALLTRVSLPRLWTRSSLLALLGMGPGLGPGLPPGLSALLARRGLLAGLSRLPALLAVP